MQAPKICILDTFGFNRCRRRKYEYPVKSFRPKKVLIVFWQYLSHLTCSRVHSCCFEIRITRHVTSCHVMSRYVTPCHVMSRHVMPCHVTSCHVMSRRVTSCHVMSRHVASRPVPSRSVMSRHIASWHVTSCHVMLLHVTSCHVMSRHVTSCHVMSRHVTSCHVMSRHVTSCYVISRRKSRDGHTTNASLSTDFFHTQLIQIKHDRVRWLSRRLPIPYRISGIWSSLISIFFLKKDHGVTIWNHRFHIRSSQKLFLHLSSVFILFCSWNMTAFAIEPHTADEWWGAGLEYCPVY